MTTFQRPYFFEEHFPLNYYLPFAPPIQRHPGSQRHPGEELEKGHIDKDGYHVFVDVKDFQPNEISVRTINEIIIVEGKQEKRPGNLVPRHFVRHFHLPDFYDSEDVFSTISDDGILEICALAHHQKRYYKNVVVADKK